MEKVDERVKRAAHLKRQAERDLSALDGTKYVSLDLLIIVSYVSFGMVFYLPLYISSIDNSVIYLKSHL